MAIKDITKKTETEMKGGLLNKDGSGITTDFINRAHPESIHDYNGKSIGYDQYNQGWRPVNDDGSFSTDGWIEKAPASNPMTLAAIAQTYAVLKKQEGKGIEHLLLATQGHIKNLRSLRVKISSANDTIKKILEEKDPGQVPKDAEELKKASWRLVGLKAAWPRRKPSSSEQKNFNDDWKAALKELTGKIYQ